TYSMSLTANKHRSAVYRVVHQWRSGMSATFLLAKPGAKMACDYKGGTKLAFGKPWKDEKTYACKGMGRSTMILTNGTASYYHATVAVWEKVLPIIKQPVARS